MGIERLAPLGGNDSGKGVPSPVQGVYEEAITTPEAIKVMHSEELELLDRLSREELGSLAAKMALRPREKPSDFEVGPDVYLG